MCLGTIAVLAEAWGTGPTRAGRLDDGTIVPLAFVPDADAGSHLLVHLGVAVEVLEPDDAADAFALRSGRADDNGGPS